MAIQRKGHSRGATRLFALLTAVLLMTGAFMAPAFADTSGDEAADQATTSSEEKAPASEPAPEAEVKEEAPPAPDPAPKEVESAPAADSTSDIADESTPSQEPVESDDSESTQPEAPAPKAVAKAGEAPDNDPHTSLSFITPCRVDVTNDNPNTDHDTSYDVVQGSVVIVQGILTNLVEMDAGSQIDTYVNDDLINPVVDGNGPIKLVAHGTDDQLPGSYPVEVDGANCGGEGPPDDPSEPTFAEVTVVQDGNGGYTVTSPSGNPEVGVLPEGSDDPFFLDGGTTSEPQTAACGTVVMVYDPEVIDYETGEPADAYRQTFTIECDPQEPYIETSNEVRCGEVDITLRNVSPWIYPVSVETDGVHSYGPVVDNRGDAPDDQTKTRTITFDEDSGTHTVRYRVDAGTESDLYRDLPVGGWTELTVESDCEPPIVISPSATVEVACDGTGTATLDNSASTTEVGIEVVVNGVATPYSVEAGKSEVVDFTGAEPGSEVIVQDDTGTLASVTVPASCDDNGDGDGDGDGDGNDGDPVKPVSDTPKSPVTDDTVNAVLPNTGGAEAMYLWLGLTMTALGFMVARRRKMIG